ncbi:MAG: phosphoglucomutase/phosphomannomutase family protein [Verrucomicrobiota bacterium]|nr:phosphoglucomutase/phosphomannomutase family protein [Verrucomicrobiota bacterium]
MKVSRIKFGTDGWRAVIAEDFTFENVEIVAQATADYWRTHRPKGLRKRVVIGCDRRFLADQFAEKVAEVFAGNGFEVVLGRTPSPTPAVSFAVRSERAVGGVVLTGSHNPARFCGFKLKGHYGGSAPSETCYAVEAMLGAKPVRSLDLEKARRKSLLWVKDLNMPHVRAISRKVDFELISKSGLRFAHDALFGVGAGAFEKILAGTSCRVTTLNAEHDPFFGGIHPEPIVHNYGPSAAYLRKNPHDLCLVTDGDADRVGGMDGRGNALTTHQIICLLLYHYFQNRGQKGRVIKALTTTSMVDRMCEAYGLELLETGVGFKYICTEMQKGDVLLGFEESGGIGFHGHIPERDGILAGLALLELLATEKTTVKRLLARLEKRFGEHHYNRLDTNFPLKKRAALMKLCAEHPPAKLAGSPLAEVKTFDGVKYIADNGAWLMLRGSGTEPILRIYAEANSVTKARQLIQLGVRLTHKV